MTISFETRDEAVLVALGNRLLHLRLAANLTQAELARGAGLGKITVERIEAGRPSELRTLIRVLRVLGRLEALNALLPEPGPSPIQSLRLRGSGRRRASGRRVKKERLSADLSAWRWGDEDRPHQS